eukprot:1194413-Rhodomonas_salina.2
MRLSIGLTRIRSGARTTQRGGGCGAALLAGAAAAPKNVSTASTNGTVDSENGDKTGRFASINGTAVSIYG